MLRRHRQVEEAVRRELLPILEPLLERAKGIRIVHVPAVIEDATYKLVQHRVAAGSAASGTQGLPHRLTEGLGGVLPTGDPDYRDPLLQQPAAESGEDRRHELAPGQVPRRAKDRDRDRLPD